MRVKRWSARRYIAVASCRWRLIRAWRFCTIVIDANEETAVTTFYHVVATDHYSENFNRGYFNSYVSQTDSIVNMYSRSIYIYIILVDRFDRTNPKFYGLCSICFVSFARFAWDVDEFESNSADRRDIYRYIILYIYSMVNNNNNKKEKLRARERERERERKWERERERERKRERERERSQAVRNNTAREMSPTLSTDPLPLSTIGNSWTWNSDDKTIMK